MKKNLFLASLLVLSITASAQSNLFDAADIDEDGWLWFNTQEKIDKYVSLINEDEYRLDLNGKPVQLVYADQLPDYPAPVADPEMYGIGSDGYSYGDTETGGLPMGMDAIKGSIMLPKSSGIMNYNGGGIALMLPSCKELSIKVSSEASFYLRILCSKENDAVFSDVNIGEKYVEHKWSNIKAYSSFGAPKKGQRDITGIESMTNGYYDLTIKSEEPRYVYITHGNKYPVFVHAIKVICSGNSSGINDIESYMSDNSAEYNVLGQRVGKNAKGLVIKNGHKYIR